MIWPVTGPPLCAGIRGRVCTAFTVEVQALIILVWAVWHSERMCSSLRNNLVLLAGEGGPAMTANKGTHTHTLQDKNMYNVNKPLCVLVCVCVKLNCGVKMSIYIIRAVTDGYLHSFSFIFLIN